MRNDNRMEYLIGIDDTDNKTSRGTGYRSRELADFLYLKGIAEVKGITRHQLFVHPDIPYTSQNSSACLHVTCENYKQLQLFCRNYMLKTAATGSDVGLCIANIFNINQEIINWGVSAKSKVLTMEQAYQLAQKNDIYLEGLTGEKCGIIGALAAIGLRKSGNDGRFIKAEGTDLRALTGIINVNELIKSTAINQVENTKFNTITNGRIYLGNWIRPILKNHKITLIVESTKNINYEWKVTGKDFIKKLSN